MLLRVSPSGHAFDGLVHREHAGGVLRDQVLVPTIIQWPKCYRACLHVE